MSLLKYLLINISFLNFYFFDFLLLLLLLLLLLRRMCVVGVYGVYEGAHFVMRQNAVSNLFTCLLRLFIIFCICM